MENAFTLVNSINQCVNAITITQKKLINDKKMNLINIDNRTEQRIAKIGTEATLITTDLKKFIPELYNVEISENITLGEFLLITENNKNLVIDRDYIDDGNEALKNLHELNVEIKAIYHSHQKSATR
jgi:hypothetical protein